MIVKIYTKKNCEKCSAAKDKLRMLGIGYEEIDSEQAFQPHEGWREDGSSIAMAVYQFEDTLPIFVIDGEGYNYPDAMKWIKKMHGKGD